MSPAALHGSPSNARSLIAGVVPDFKGQSKDIVIPPVELFPRDHRTTFCEGYSATIVVISTILGLVPSVACILRIFFVTLMRGWIVGME